jgi:hypothetical protein
MKARVAAGGYMKPGPSLPPYHYIAPDRIALAQELGHRSRDLHKKYSGASTAADEQRRHG